MYVVVGNLRAVVCVVVQQSMVSPIAVGMNLTNPTNSPSVWWRGTKSLVRSSGLSMMVVQ